MSKASARPLEGTWKARSQGWQGMGSLSLLQRLVGRPIAYVTNTNERLGIGQGWHGVSSVCAARGISGVCPGKPGHSNARVNACVIAPARLRCDARPPFPPPPYRSASGGLPQFFPSFSPKLFSPLFPQLCKLAKRKEPTWHTR